ncbi:Zinc finger C2H2-type/integrase DNA-binding domain [Penicillium roqueforti FM164]|uniref:Zinc finger C2H2-type/integrase DNA-binding domain n=1 Tax=Penicillium roqueforti (strain FM164) TaxID=1365484 RepID=W6Q095_PENRF|nr:Zinc finger C2H2-type/integrase DNA-binding domain [Penicillium roqueforti FM164]
MSDTTGPDVTRRGKQCSYCDRAFARREHICRHERSPRSVKPFGARDINQMFSRSQ